MSAPYVGEIRMFGFTRVPTGWLACDGSLQPISLYETLFMLIGTIYGGDGETSFAVPNLCGTVPLHQGTGQGLSTYVIGQAAGSENITLLPTQMPGHNHPMTATTTTAASTSISSTQQLGAVSNEALYTTDTTGLAPFLTSPASTQAVGNTQPHDNLMPTLTVQFCIASSGIFPQQSATA